MKNYAFLIACLGISMNVEAAAKEGSNVKNLIKAFDKKGDDNDKKDEKEKKDEKNKKPVNLVSNKPESTNTREGIGREIENLYLAWLGSGEPTQGITRTIFTQRLQAFIKVRDKIKLNAAEEKQRAAAEGSEFFNFTIPDRLAKFKWDDKKKEIVEMR